MYSRLIELLKTEIETEEVELQKALYEVGDSEGYLSELRRSMKLAESGFIQSDEVCLHENYDSYGSEIAVESDGVTRLVHVMKCRQCGREMKVIMNNVPAIKEVIRVIEKGVKPRGFEDGAELRHAIDTRLQDLYVERCKEVSRLKEELQNIQGVKEYYYSRLQEKNSTVEPIAHEIEKRLGNIDDSYAVMQLTNWALKGRDQV